MPSALKELLEQRDTALAEVEGITTAVAERPEDERELTEDEEARSAELLSEIDKIDGRIKEEKVKVKRAKMLAEARKLVEPPEDASKDGTGSIQVDEPMVYGEGSPYSYYADLARSVAGYGWGPNQGAPERLTRWAHQLEREFANGSKMAKVVERQLRELNRKTNPAQTIADLAEVRDRGRTALEDKVEERAGVVSGGGAAVSSSGGGGAAFISPVIFIGDYAPYREFGRAFIDQCNKQPLPDYGMEVYIPYVGGPAGIANQGSDGLPINETDPTFGYRSGSLQTEAGQVTVTQVLLDRAGPGFSFDRMIFDQLNRAYAPVVDTYVLNQALLNATTQIWSGNAGAFDLTVTSGSGGFYGQVSKAKAGIRTSAGTVLNPQHLFLYATRWEYIAAWSDSQGRPVVVPDYANAFNAVAAGNPSGDVGIEGNTGYRFNGLRAFTDQNIPLFGTTSEDQVIVGDLNEVYVYEGEPVTRAVPQTLAQNLQVLLQQYSYITSIVRYPAAVVSITGTGMSTISYTN